MNATPDGGPSQRPQDGNHQSNPGKHEKASRKRPKRPPEHWLTSFARHLLHVSIFVLMEMIPTELAAEDLLILFRWPGGIIKCPMAETGQCSGTKAHEVLPKRRPRKFFCNECHLAFTVRYEASNTAMHGSHLPFRVWIWALYFKANTQGLKICELREYLGVSKRTAQRLYRILPGPLRKVNPGPLPVPQQEYQQPNGFDPDAEPGIEAPEAQPGPAMRWSVMDMMRLYRTERDCDQMLTDTLHPDGIKSPSKTQNCAGSPIPEVETVSGLRTFQRSGYSQHFTVRTNTVMERSQLPSKVWVWAAYFMVNTSIGISASRLARYLGIRRATAHHLTHRLREAMQETDPPLMSGIAEVDETVWKFEKVLGKSRLYTVVLRSRNPDKVYVVPVLARTKAQLRTIIIMHIAKQAIVCTDGWSGYHGLESLGYIHVWVIHKDRVYATRIMEDPEGFPEGLPKDLVVHVNGAESFNSRLRMAARKTYRGRYSPQHMALYHIQDAWLHNHRDMAVLDRVKKVLSQTVGRRLTLKELRQALPRLEELVSMHRQGDGKVLVMLDRYASWMLNDIQPMLFDFESLPSAVQSPKRPKRPTKARPPLPENLVAMWLPGFAQLLQPDDR